MFDSFTSLGLEPLTTEQAHNFISFVENNRFLKISTKTLELPSIQYKHSNLLITVYDVKVFSKGPDDKIYASTNDNKVPDNEKIRNWITRGCILVNVKDKNTNQDIYWNLFQGLCKFSGMTDEDDDDISALNEKKSNNKKSDQDSENSEDLSNSSNNEEIQDVSYNFFNSSKRDPFFILPFGEATKIVNTRKENGKACHLAVFEIENNGENIRFYVSGSKNVHIVFRTLEDIPDDNILHNRAARSMIKMISELKDSEKEKFLSLLSKTGFVANFEFLLPEDQHIVDYQLKEDTPRFLTFSGRRILNDSFINVFGKCVNPMEAISWAKSIGLPVAEVCDEYDMNPQNLKKIIDQVRQEEKSEGSVFYFIKNQKVIGLWKLKSLWYIMFRAIREKIVRLPIDYNKLIKKRFKDIQNWVRLTNEEVLKWRIIAAKLYEYHIDLIKNQDLENSHIEIRGSFAVNLRKFLDKFKLPEDLDEAIEDLCYSYDIEGIKKLKEKKKVNNRKKKN